MLVGGISLGQRQVRQFFKGQRVFLAVLALQLAFQDARGSHRGNAHAVAYEQDHVLGAARVGVKLLGFPERFLAGLVPGGSAFDAGSAIFLDFGRGQHAVCTQCESRGGHDGFQSKFHFHFHFQAPGEMLVLNQNLH
ncbi:hypothetical protein SFMTTN_0931 [Sulfuriferula multivorans]|uniref:Uncharacterized protein n=1 Tax=Sulfuriferula multivorans TaxID=1559896 RepID=A0A401JBY8_9PROT|nr:hypothetical protein SFMTTN_0931 [Sulfuriferula multivorans]